MHRPIAAAALAISSLVGAGVTAAAECAAGGSEFRNGRGFAELSGFEGSESALGAAVAKAILEASPTKGPEHDFSGREEMLGQGVATVIRTLNVREPYQHETNDALVKMTLTYIQFAKQHELLEDGGRALVVLLLGVEGGEQAQPGLLGLVRHLHQIGRAHV